MRARTGGIAVLKYIARRLLLLVPTVWVLATITFFVMQAVPGDTTDILLQNERDPEVAAVLRRQLGLDRSALEQYVRWLGNAVRGDFGRSALTGRQILPDVMTRIGATVHLTVGGVIVAVLLALPTGLISGLRRGRPSDLLIRVGAFIGVSVPSFWLGLMLVVVFAVNLRWLPSSNFVSFFDDPWDSVRHLILPSVALGIATAGSMTRMLRASVIETSHQEHVRMAVAKGVPRPLIVRRHVLRPALIPSVTLLGLLIGNLLGGTVVIEKVFAWPGIGRYLLDGIFGRDYLVVQTLIVIYGTVFVLINVAVDVTYALIDPRIRRT